jgi:hypothetical protein
MSDVHFWYYAYYSFRLKVLISEPFWNSIRTEYHERIFINRWKQRRRSSLFRALRRSSSCSFPAKRVIGGLSFWLIGWNPVSRSSCGNWCWRENSVILRISAEYYICHFESFRLFVESRMVFLSDGMENVCRCGRRVVFTDVASVNWQSTNLVPLSKMVSFTTCFLATCSAEIIHVI